MPYATVWLDALDENRMDFSLDRMHRFLRDAGPFPFTVVHVGGTNGKGSVCHFIARILQEMYVVGRYTSPHLQHVNERIAVNGVSINDTELERYDYLVSYGFTYFEALTAVALLHFHSHGASHAVLEVGLGGRLDATNVLDPAVTVITNVELEHEHILGPTVEAIAREKAGVIKQAPVVTACHGAALDVVEAVARRHDVPVYAVGRDISWKKTVRAFHIQAKRHYEVAAPLFGRYQGENMALVVKVCELLGIPAGVIVAGILHTRIPGRMERIGRVILDGCHNPAAVAAFTEAVRDIPHSRLCIIFGVMRDKNVDAMLATLPDARAYFAVSLKNPRSLPAQKIAARAACLGKSFFAVETMEEALTAARSRAGADDLICVVGSLYAVGEARTILCETG
jgi:dihydrofolate synthase/folylpolyglutamate synthase